MKDNKWVPCSEKLPVGKEYIISCHGIDFYKHTLISIKSGRVLTGFYDQDLKQWWWLDFNRSSLGDDVIAWQPLPEPYKEEE